ncbi:hypothetical protein POM88_011935 [Heracleum sosnowskyi]|uniref:F-box domain-containing protein n=1 Tax=Heracleum sosnowskyi TaxID=360622 RepID=A0AAD8IX75_9APIA|nr:hypothetical protein POM88_011935 [Heracleum sosnowskyi]
MSSIDILTQDLITQILVKLPVKTLLCCKSVSKPWLSLISSSDFIISHLKHTVTNPGGADQAFIVHEYDDYSMYSLNLDAPQPKAPLGFPYSQGDYPFEPDYKIVGSYNGIVCVSISNCERERKLIDFDWFCNSSYYRNNPSTYIWNPATKQSKLVPPHNIRENVKSLSFGFGFDVKGNDFKVLRVISSFDEPFCAEVYSANANVWRKIDPRPTDYPEYDEFDVCVNGFLCCEGLYGMMAFDLHKEVFTCGIHPLPARSFNSTFIDFKGSIGIITSKGYESNAYNLWTLDDEACLHGGGVNASWTPRLSIDVDYPSPYPPHVYGCFDSGEFLLCAGSGTYLLQNSNNKEPRNVPLLNTIGRRLIKYNGSMVSITGSKQVHWNAQENDI